MEGRPVVLLPIAEYRTLLEQNVLAPKQGKYNPLSAKQKRKVEDKIAQACVVVMVRTLISMLVQVYTHTRLLVCTGCVACCAPRSPTQDGRQKCTRCYGTSGLRVRRLWACTHSLATPRVLRALPLGDRPLFCFVWSCALLGVLARIVPQTCR
jgi:hypothetical protein